MLIIGVSGKKQSGKTSLCEYLQMWLEFQNAPLFYKDFEIFQDQDKDGEVRAIFKNSKMPLADEDTDAFKARSKRLSKLYSFADPLKKLVCNQVLGIPMEQLYGTDYQKNSKTHFIWDNLPLSIREEYSHDSIELPIESDDIHFPGVEMRVMDLPRCGPMTAREVMQVVGTDIFRRQFNDNIWVDATLELLRATQKNRL